MSSPRLKAALDRLYADFNRPEAAADPVHCVHRYREADDREVVGFCAAALAFGRVTSVLQSVEALLARMGPRPAAFVRSFDPARDGPRLGSLVHRWARATDLAALLWILRQMLEQAGSVEGFFLEGYDKAAADLGGALDAFTARARSINLGRVYGRQPPRPGVWFFFPRPASGSGCKRLNLFLRWMVRHDAIDLGVWTRVSPAQLVVPLDTHVVRVGRCLGLTRYASAGWPMASEITASLRQLDPHDPVKYDFSLCHLGMMNACGFGRPRGDAHCPLRGMCRPHGLGRTRRKAGAPTETRG